MAEQNWGLLAGLAQGLNQGIDSFRENERYKEDRNQRRKNDALTRALQLKQIKESGFDYDDDTGEVTPTAGLLPKADRELETFRKKEEIKNEIRNRGTGGPKSIADDLTPGEKAVDTSFGKELGDWSTSGRATTAKNLKRLEDASQYLSQHQNDLIGTSGRLTGRLPDLFKSDKTIATRDDVRAAAQGALKQVLGAQFTEREGERIMNAAYNEKLSPAENIKKIAAAIQEIKSIANEKDAQAAYFNKVGSLKGYKSGSGLLGSKGINPQAEKIAKAKAAGYTDEQIQQYLQGR